MGQLGDISPEGSVAIGIIVGLLSTSIQSLGLTLQRQSHLREDQKIAPETRKPPYKRPRWQAGMLMFVVSNLVGSTIQITTLPLPVLSTLQASGLVFNTAFATLLLKEPFTRYSLIGTILTCTGAALIAIFGALAEPAHSLRQLLDLLEKKGFIIWMVATMLVAVATIVFAHVLKVLSSYKHMSRHMHRTERPRSSSKVDGHAEPRSRRQSFTSQLPRPLQIRLSRLRLIRGLSYALVSGILSAHSLLVAKSAVELIIRTIVDHDNQFKSFQSWLILLALVFFALSQLYYLHLGLRLCSTSVLYPFVFCIYNIIAILDGLIYFRQASRLNALHGALIAVGTVVLLSGVLALSWRLDDTTPSEPAPQISAPHTPLAPGMGLFRSSEEFERSPKLDSLARASTEPMPSFDERTPLLSRPARRLTLTKSTISPGGAAARDIWAELDDEEDSHDFLASLPQTRSPLIPSKPKLELPKRRRRASLPTRDEPESPTASQPSRRKRHSLSIHTYSQQQMEATAALLQSPLQTSNSLGNELKDSQSTTSDKQSSQRKVSRDRRVTVHFEEENLRDTSPRRSRWDAGASNGSESNPGKSGSSSSGGSSKGSKRKPSPTKGSSRQEDSAKTKDKDKDSKKRDEDHG